LRELFGYHLTMSDGASGGACCFCVCLITSCILFGVSWDVIEPTELGLAFDGNIQKIEGDKVFSSGRYLIGLGRSFIIFPATQQTLRFGDPVTMHYDEPDSGDIECRTKDGLAIRLEVAVQFLISNKKEDLYRLYLDTGGDWRFLYLKLVQHVVRDVASLYEAIEFREARDVIAIDITDKLDRVFKTMYASVPSAQLINMEIENALETAITKTQVAKQDVYQATNEQQVIAVEAQQGYDVSMKLKKIRIETATREALRITAVAQAQANIIENNINAQIQAYQNLTASLGLDTPAKLLSYLWLQAMQNNGVQDLVLSMDYPKSISDGL